MNKKQITWIIRIALLVGTLISLYFVPWVLLKTWFKPIPDSIQEQVNQVHDFGFEGIIVYVDQAGQAPAFYAAGWHDRDQKIPAYPEALFKIASIDKLYHAVAITKLVGDQQLALNKTLSDYYPELADRIEYANQITLKMMVQHRSGIPNFTNIPDFWNNPPDNNQDKLELILDQPASFKPDQGYEYSNTNFMLLSELIAKVIGTSSSFQYIQNTILEPLDLNHTYGSIQGVNMDNLMSGYYVGVEEDIKSANYGSMVATAQDVGIFLRALNDGSLFKNDEQKIYASMYPFNHTGLIPGYQSIAKYHPELDAVVIQFTNTTDFNGYNWSLSDMMYKRLIRILKKET